eukprot:ctg_1032.g229
MASGAYWPLLVARECGLGACYEPEKRLRCREPLGTWTSSICLARQQRIGANRAWVLRLALSGIWDSHTGCVNTLCWNDAGTLCLSGSDDTRIKIWDCRSRHWNAPAPKAGAAKPTVRRRRQQLRRRSTRTDDDDAPSTIWDEPRDYEDVLSWEDHGDGPPCAPHQHRQLARERRPHHRLVCRRPPDSHQRPGVAAHPGHLLSYGPRQEAGHHPVDAQRVSQRIRRRHRATIRLARATAGRCIDWRRPRGPSERARPDTHRPQGAAGPEHARAATRSGRIPAAVRLCAGHGRAGGGAEPASDVAHRALLPIGPHGTVQPQAAPARSHALSGGRHRRDGAPVRSSHGARRSRAALHLRAAAHRRARRADAPPPPRSHG